MEDVKETSRRKTPFPRPQSIAVDGDSVWIGSIATSKIYALDPATLRAVSESDAPGKPWGMTKVGGGDLRVICGEGDDDDRYVYDYRAGKGFAGSARFQCPESTGSQLSFDGKRLYVSQWYNRRLLGVDEAGNVEETIPIPHQICGQTFADGAFYLLTTEDESTNDYWITRVTLRSGTPAIADLARVPFAARALAFDGAQFWTNHREAGEVVTFTLP